jgi:teichuronic acid biosynthesis glycosyltransferase TuaG
MISVIIPCYNAADYIEETLNSILNQEGIELLEVIIVDDGSTDTSAKVIKSINDPRITYLYQQNKGVATARNYGLTQANGTYVIFFDADDKMSEGFLMKRLSALQLTSAGFSCGPVNTFPQQSKTTYGIAESVAEALLTYKPEFSSCPSNYLIKKSLLIENKVLFNERLSSTADRFFLIQLAKKTTGRLIKDSPLLYRVTPDSMSNKLTRKLILDNERYLFELKTYQLIPESVKKQFLFRINYILGLGFLKTGLYFKGFNYLSKAFISNPKKFLSR